MTDVLKTLADHPRYKQLSKKFGDGQEPPDNEGMDARLAKLEALIPTLATKEEVVKLRGETREGFADVRSDMHKNTAEIIKWVVGTAVVISVAAVTIITFVLNNATPKAPTAASQPPIIINVPAQAQPAKP